MLSLLRRKRNLGYRTQSIVEFIVSSVDLSRSFRLVADDWSVPDHRNGNRTVGWVISFSTFLMGCIDYSRLWGSHHLSDVVVDRCLSR